MNNDFDYANYDDSDFEFDPHEAEIMKTLKGKKKHYCPYVAHRAIDEHSEEFECCRCDFERGGNG